jgi:prepilin-type processing-associated H-X9-DG protein
MAGTRRTGNRLGVTTVLSIILAGLLVAGCGESPGSAQQVLKWAPPDAVGVIHINPNGIVNAVLDEFRKKKVDISERPWEVTQRTAGKIDAIDLFVVPDTGRFNVGVVAVVRGTVGPNDITEFYGIPTLRHLGNGRYSPFERDSDEEVIMIYGAGANDVPEGVLVFGSRRMLTDEYIKALGTGENEVLQAGMRDVRTSSEFWLVGSFESIYLPLPFHVKSLSGWLDVSGKENGRLNVTCGNENHAKKMLDEYQAVGRWLGQLATIEQKGNVVTVEIVERGLTAQLLEQWSKDLSTDISEARKVRCAANLSQIGKGAAMYMNTLGRNQYYPRSLKELVDSGVINERRVFVCPAQKTELKPGQFVTDYESFLDLVDEPLTEAKAQSSYPLAWDKKGNHPDGINVVYFDAHVEFCPGPDAYDNLIREVEELIKKGGLKRKQ